MIQHLMIEHSSIVDERQISSYADMCEREIDDTALDACLICSERMSLSRLHSHLATHMEEIALFVLPLTQNDDEVELIEESSQTSITDSKNASAVRPITALNASPGARITVVQQTPVKPISAGSIPVIGNFTSVNNRLPVLNYPTGTATTTTSKKKKKHITVSSNREQHLSTSPLAGGPPVFPRVHRKFLDIETLKYYDIPWEWDHVSLVSDR